MSGGSSCTRITPFASQSVGELHLLCSRSNKSLSKKQIYPGHNLMIGRDRKKCQWVIDDPQMSSRHLRVYTIIYENEEDNQLQHLIYAEDLSRNGTFWNGSLIGKGNGGFLLSHHDKLRLSSTTSFLFVASEISLGKVDFGIGQEREMNLFSDKYVVTDRLLGAGAFGRVFMAIDQRTRTQVACKVIDLRKMSARHTTYFSGKGMPTRAGEINQDFETWKVKEWSRYKKEQLRIQDTLKNCYHEIEVLSQLKHPNIVTLDKVYVTKNTIYMFQDLITAGDLFSYLESQNGQLTEIEAAVVIRQILVALEFIHDRNIVHRDLKPENIMMTNLSVGCRVVLTDFGAAKKLNPSQRTNSIIGSLPYTAPEVLNTQMNLANHPLGYTKAVDMWSAGAVSVVLLTGASAFSDPYTGEYSASMARNCNLQNLASSEAWQQIRARPRDFVAKLLVLDESKRMTARQALQHDWFSNEIHKTDFEDLYQRTIKNWRPRAAKRQVMEYLDTFHQKTLPPPNHRQSPNRKFRRGSTPVEPPYKPYPRDMHMALWPEPKDTSQSSSERVKNAIKEVWNRESAKTAEHPSSSTLWEMFVRSNSAKTSKNSGLKRQHHTFSKFSKHPSSPSHSEQEIPQHLTSTSRPDTPTPVTNTKNKLMRSDIQAEPIEHSQLKSHPDVVGGHTPELDIHQPPASPQPNQQDDQSMPPPPPSPRSLKRRARSTSTRIRSKKRQRGSIFDIVDEDEEK